ncbi:hypothetical protein Hanom_Chr06g00539901 [Helianthus anomalus]
MVNLVLDELTSLSHFDIRRTQFRHSPTPAGHFWTITKRRRGSCRSNQAAGAVRESTSVLFFHYGILFYDKQILCRNLILCFDVNNHPNSPVHNRNRSSPENQSRPERSSETHSLFTFDSV